MLRVEILDRDIFHGVVPHSVENYLRVNEWQEQRRLPNDVAIWFRQAEGGDVFRLWLPLNYQLADYAEMMKRAISVIAEAEKLSQLQVLADINTTAVGDVIRACSQDLLDRGSDSLPLSEGVALIDQAKTMLTAAAMSEIQAREVHPSHRSLEVIQYLENIRLGQTEPGSYIVKLISPISDVQPEEGKALPHMPPVLPFERRAVMRLVRALEATEAASRDIHRRHTFNLRAFLEVVPQGVSANLCEAIARKGPGNSYKPIEVSVTWSYALPPPDGARRVELEFPTDYMQYIAEAARQFRERNPETRSITGYVKVLSREKGETSGMISLVCLLGKVQRVVRVELGTRDYQAAIRAHENEFMATVEGDLTQRGHLFYLLNPRNFTVAETQSMFQDPVIGSDMQEDDR